MKGDMGRLNRHNGRKSLIVMGNLHIVYVGFIQRLHLDITDDPVYQVAGRGLIRRPRTSLRFHTQQEMVVLNGRVFLSSP